MRRTKTNNCKSPTEMEREWLWLLRAKNLTHYTGSVFLREVHNRDAIMRWAGLCMQRVAWRELNFVLSDAARTANVNCLTAYHLMEGYEHEWWRDSRAMKLALCAGGLATNSLLLAMYCGNETEKELKAQESTLFECLNIPTETEYE